MATKIEFYHPKPRIEDWRVKLNGMTIGSVWRVAEGCYAASVAELHKFQTKAAAFKDARKQAKSITAA